MMYAMALILDAVPRVTPLIRRRQLAQLDVRPPLGDYLRGIWRFRSFLWLLAVSKAEKINQRGSRGTFWNITDPLMIATRFILLFALVFPDREQANTIAFITIGIFTWEFWESFIMKSFKLLKQNERLISSHSFPHAIVVIADALAEALNFRYTLLVMFFVVLISGFFPYMVPMLPNFAWIGVIPALLLIVIWGFGAACIAARIGTKLPHLRRFLALPLMFLRVSSGVMFAVNRFVPIVGQTTVDIIQLLPGGVYVYLMRSVLLQDPLFPPSLTMWVLGVFWAISSLYLGITVFWQGEPDYGKEARQLAPDSLIVADAEDWV